MQQLARALELPTAASSADIRQMIEGKLQEIGREPLNAQVVVQQEVGGPRVRLSLQDAEGIFLEADLDVEPEQEAEKDTQPALKVRS